MNKFEELKQLVETVSYDVEKFYNKGNKAAGVRIRKAMQDIKLLAQDVRIDVQKNKNNL